MNDLMIFENAEFGKVRTVLLKDKLYFVGNDIAKDLGYARPKDAISAHCKGAVKHRIPTNGGIQEMIIISEGDVYRLISHSKLPSAEKFESWIFDNVLPTIRKTGSYSTKQDDQLKAKRADAMLYNAKSRQSKLWLQIAAQASLPAYKQIATAYAANTLADKRVFELPASEKRTYSATEIGDLLGVSSNRIGIIANKNKLKTDTYGALFLDKSRHSAKEVETFRYYENAIPVFKTLLGVQ